VENLAFQNDSQSLEADKTSDTGWKSWMFYGPKRLSIESTIMIAGGDRKDD